MMSSFKCPQHSKPSLSEMISQHLGGCLQKLLHPSPKLLYIYTEVTLNLVQKENMLKPGIFLGILISCL